MLAHLVATLVIVVLLIAADQGLQWLERRRAPAGGP
jgi:hypothetical protein